MHNHGFTGNDDTLEQQEHAIQAAAGAPNNDHDHHDKTEVTSSDSSSDSHNKSLGDTFKHFMKVMNPVSPTARGDMNILKHSLYVNSHAKQDIHDAIRYPEINKVAEVRRGSGLCPEEAEWLQARKLHIRDHFARYIGVDPAEVHPDDIPVVGFGGSGGGMRAMIGFLGYAAEMKKSGLWDVLAYTAGVSGACWSLAAYYTFAHGNMEEVIEHCKRRLNPHHPLSEDAIRALLLAPGGVDMAFGPLVQKQKSGLHVVPMDLYSVFVSGHIFRHDVDQRPYDVAGAWHGGYKREWFKWSNAQKYLADGKEPLPILTAIRHERPWNDWADKEHAFKDEDYSREEHSAAKDAWFQWFEMTPFEVGCDELEAYVPIWGFGRPFNEGKSTMQLPEHSLALLLGLCTSAPAGPMTSYIATLKRNLPTGFIGSHIQEFARGITKIWGKEGTKIFEQHHPLHACNEHNPVFHLTKVPPGQARPPSIENSPRIHLIDSGMDNNCPTYVLLHQAREADIIINMDASSDVQKDSFQQRVDQIGGRRGLKYTKRHPYQPGPDLKDPDRFRDCYAQIYDCELAPRPTTVIDSYGKKVTTPPAPVSTKPCSMVYMPLLPHERAVPEFDPSTAKFSGSYNLVWTPEQVDTLVKVCAANFKEGETGIKDVLIETWKRKKLAREEGGGRSDSGPGVKSGVVQVQSQAQSMVMTEGVKHGMEGVGLPDRTGVS